MMETPIKNKSGDNTGVSRSGRVRKKSSKLADFESPDEIDTRFKRKTDRPQKSQKSIKIGQSLGSDIFDDSDSYIDDEIEVKDEPLEVEDWGDNDDGDDDMCDDGDDRDDGNDPLHVDDDSTDMPRETSNYSQAQSLYFSEKQGKKNIMLKDGQVVRRKKAQRKDKGMGRHQENPMRQHFTYDPASNTSTWKIESCGVKIKGNHGGNLQRHIGRKHVVVFAETQQATQVSRKRLADEQMTLDALVVKKPKHIQISLTPGELREACLELVTVNGRPFSLIEDLGFRKIIDLIQTVMGIKINQANIRDMVAEAAQRERDKLIKELSGKLLMIKIDSATCRERSVLGINVQYTDGNGILLRTLAVRELTERHTASYISSIVRDVLSEYSIDIKQVYSVTSDNGANMLKAVDLADIQELSNRGGATEDATVDDTEEDTEVQEGQTGEQVEEITVELEAPGSGHVLRSVRCSAHTLQLAVEDTLRDKSTSNLLHKTRRVAKKLRTPNIVSVLKKMGQKRAIVDCPTSWHSTHNMIEWLIELKTFCEDLSPTVPELNLSECEWNSVSDLVSGLKLAKIAKCLQSEQLTAGDFYGAWLRCMLDTERVNTPFAKLLVQCMKGRQGVLFDNEAFTAAIFLDPRYRLFLTEHQTNVAKVHLCCVGEAIQNLAEQGAAGPSCSPALSSEDEDDEIEQMLMAKEKESTSAPCRPVSISSLLEAYTREARLKRTECIFKYWSSMAVANPDLHKLAMSVIALPVTQVSVERAFSGLKFILSFLRSSLNNKVLEDILFLRLNRQYGL